MSRLVAAYVARARKACLQDDNDCVTLVCGAEGSGKTDFALMLAARVDPQFGADQVVFSGTQHGLIAKRFFRRGEKGRAVFMDESTRAAYRRRSMHGTNVDFVADARENRKMNLAHFILYPWLIEVDSGISHRRAHYLWIKKDRRTASLYVARRSQFKKTASWNYQGTVRRIPRVDSELWDAYKARVRDYLEAKEKSKDARLMEEFEERIKPVVQLMHRFLEDPDPLAGERRRRGRPRGPRHEVRRAPPQ